MANGVHLICWETSDRFGIGIQIKNLAGKNHEEGEEIVQIDTGFSEEILLPYLLYESLDLNRWRLPSSLSPRGTTVTGQIIHFMESYVDVQIPKTDERYRVIAQTFAGNTRFLIGRGFLRRIRVLLDGVETRTCIWQG